MTPEEARAAVENAAHLSDTDPKVPPQEKQEGKLPPTPAGPIAERVSEHLSHGYKEDLAQAMNATDASVVQDLLSNAREREVFEKKERERIREKKWFSLTSFFLIILALAIGGYGIYHYTHLTVPIQKPVSVGVFPSVAAVPSTTTLETLLPTLLADQTLKSDTPYLVPITDSATSALLTNQAFFSYIGASVDEPFAAAFSSVRLGVMKNSQTNAASTFIIGSVTDPVTATKELLIDEPNLLRQFAPALGIAASDFSQEIGTSFTQEYRYNLPYRFLSVTGSADASKQNILYYGFAADSVVVIATDPSVLKAVSDTVIRQQ